MLTSAVPQSALRLSLAATLGVLLLALIGIGIVSLIGVVAYLGVNSHPAVTLPAPTGPYRVGRVIDDWVDQTRRDPLAPVPRPREISVWIWYPAPHAAHGYSASYVPPAWQRVFRLGPLQSLMRTSPALIHPLAIAQAPVAGSHLRRGSRQPWLCGGRHQPYLCLL